MSERNYNILDHLIIGFDRQLESFRHTSDVIPRPSPAEGIEEGVLDETERQCSEGLMRVNHAGEISAQALYQGQKLSSCDPDICATLQRSAEEEIDHLNWCGDRLLELGGRISYLSPLWYIWSFSIGTLVGLIGDKWSLGFIVETENQVVEHLNDHLNRLPVNDSRSRAIIKQMKEDEAHHATVAFHSGAAELPGLVKTAMKLASKVMTITAYRI